MLDWDTYAGSDPLLAGGPEQPWPQEQAALAWLTPAPEDGLDAWLPSPGIKGGLDDFGPMSFWAGGEDDGVPELDEVVVTGTRHRGLLYDRIFVEYASSWGDDSGMGGGGGGGQAPTGVIDNMLSWIDSFLDRFGDSATELADRDERSTFDRSRAEPLYRDGRQVGYVYNDGSFW